MTVDWWTLGLQTINFLVLAWLLGRFFWRPVAAIIEERRAAARRILDEAESRRGEVTAALADVERTRAGFQHEREAMLAAARSEAEVVRSQALEQVARELAAERAAAVASLERDREANRRAWVERATHLAVDIAGKLTTRLDGAASRSAFLDDLVREIRKLPEDARRAVARDGATLEAVSATAIGPDEQDRYRSVIGDALGGAATIVFATDPALIAGLELRGPHFVVANSWRADLARIQDRLRHAELA